MKKLTWVMTIVILLQLTLLTVQYYTLAMSTAVINCTPNVEDTE